MYEFVNFDHAGIIKFAWNGTAEKLKSFPGDGYKKMIVMQSTGLKDKKGTEIYEGDILELVSWREGTNVPNPQAWTKGEVCFSNGAFRIHAYIVCEVASDCIVIGNIYENPDLLPS